MRYIKTDHIFISTLVSRVSRILFSAPPCVNLENQEIGEVKSESSECSEMGVLRYGSEAWKLLRGVTAIYKVQS